MKVSELVNLFGGELIGLNRGFQNMCSLESARYGDLSFVLEKRIDKFEILTTKTEADSLIVHESLEEYCRTNSEDRSFILCSDPKLYFAKVQNFINKDWFDRIKVPPIDLIHRTALISPKSSIGKNVRIGAYTVIEDDVQIGDGCIIDHHVTIYSGCSIGRNCRIQSNSVIGSQGFGLVHDGESWVDLIHSGGVIIEDDVSIGSNVVVDRGTLDSTLICKGAKLDNLIQIAHNVQIGPGTAIAANVGIAGSTRIGANCLIGGAAMISGHLNICDSCVISGGSLIDSDIKVAGRYTSVFPYLPHGKWRRAAAKIRRG